MDGLQERQKQQQQQLKEKPEESPVDVSDNNVSMVDSGINASGPHSSPASSESAFETEAQASAGHVADQEPADRCRSANGFASTSRRGALPKRQLSLSDSERDRSARILTLLYVKLFEELREKRPVQPAFDDRSSAARHRVNSRHLNDNHSDPLIGPLTLQQAAQVADLARQRPISPTDISSSLGQFFRHYSVSSQEEDLAAQVPPAELPSLQPITELSTADTSSVFNRDVTDDIEVDGPVNSGPAAASTRADSLSLSGSSVAGCFGGIRTRSSSSSTSSDSSKSSDGVLERAKNAIRRLRHRSNAKKKKSSEEKLHGYGAFCSKRESSSSRNVNPPGASRRSTHSLPETKTVTAPLSDSQRQLITAHAAEIARSTDMQPARNGKRPTWSGPQLERQPKKPEYKIRKKFSWFHRSTSRQNSKSTAPTATHSIDYEVFDGLPGPSRRSQPRDEEIQDDYNVPTFSGGGLEGRSDDQRQRTTPHGPASSSLLEREAAAQPSSGNSGPNRTSVRSRALETHISADDFPSADIPFIDQDSPYRIDWAPTPTAEQINSITDHGVSYANKSEAGKNESVAMLADFLLQTRVHPRTGMPPTPDSISGKNDSEVAEEARAILESLPPDKLEEMRQCFVENDKLLVIDNQFASGRGAATDANNNQSRSSSESAQSERMDNFYRSLPDRDARLLRELERRANYFELVTEFFNSRQDQLPVMDDRGIPRAGIGVVDADEPTRPANGGAERTVWDSQMLGRMVNFIFARILNTVNQPVFMHHVFAVLSGISSVVAIDNGNNGEKKAENCEADSGPTRTATKATNEKEKEEPAAHRQRTQTSRTASRPSASSSYSSISAASRFVVPRVPLPVFHRSVESFIADLIGDEPIADGCCDEALVRLDSRDEID